RCTPISRVPSAPPMATPTSSWPTRSRYSRFSILHASLPVSPAGPPSAPCCSSHSISPLLTPETFKEIYRAKLGPSAQLDSETPQQMVATMKRLGDGGDNFPGFFGVSQDALRTAGTRALLTRANPAGFIS